MMDVIVSVMCCTYNQEKYIRQCLDGFINQKTTFSFEVIVHDDASTDETPAIIKEYEEKYPDIIRGVYQKTNQFSINPKRINTFVYPLIKGKYVAFCEGDDYWCDSRKLQKQYEIMEKNPDCSLCAHKVEKIHEDGSEMDQYLETVDFKPGMISGEKYIEGIYLKSDNAFQTTSFFIKREVLFSVPKEMNDSFFVGDIPILLWAAHNGNIFFMSDICSCYRVLSEGSTNRKLENLEYAIMRMETSIAGHLAFNSVTGGRYWEYMKKDVCRRKAQLYFRHKADYTAEEKKEIFSELNIKEILIASIKFTKVGNVLRNFKRRIAVRYSAWTKRH